MRASHGMMEIVWALAPIMGFLGLLFLATVFIEYLHKEFPMYASRGNGWFGTVGVARRKPRRWLYALVCKIFRF